MKSFRTETENILSPEVEKDIIELGQKIYEYKNGTLPRGIEKIILQVINQI